MDAESCYLFQHALHRDAAYQLQLPGDRARLHALVLEIVEAFSGGRASEPQFEPGKDGALDAHATDSMANELAQHAKLAYEGRPTGELATCRRIYLHRSAILLAKMHNHEQAAAAWQELAALTGGADTAECMRRAASALLRFGKPKLAETFLREAIEKARSAKSLQHEAAALGTLGTVLLQSGRASLAREPLVAALALILGDRDPFLRASILNVLGSLCLQVGLRAEAGDAYRESLEIRRRIGDSFGEAVSLGNTAILLLQSGDFDEAKSLTRKALAICRMIKHREQEGNTLGVLAAISSDTGKYAESAEITKQALALQRETGNRRGESASWSRLGTCLFNESPAEAETAFRRALDLQTEAEEFGMAASTLNNLGNLLSYQKKDEEAAACVAKGLEYARTASNRSTEGVLLGTKARLEKISGDLGLAARTLEQALAIHRETSNVRFIGVHSCDLAVCRVGLGEIEQAAALWRNGMAILRKIGDATTQEEKTNMMLKACKQHGAAPLDA